MLRDSRKLERSLRLLVSVAVALAAYFQAMGLLALVSMHLSADPVAAALERYESASPPETPYLRKHRSAGPILARNPFDSLTGPLDGRPKASAEAKPPLNLDPLEAPVCPDVYVFSTVESSDPEWSSAVVRAKDEKRGVVRRVGAPVGVRRLAYIGFNAEHLSPAVWLAGGDGLCQALLFAEKPRTKNLLAGSPPRLVAKKPPPVAKAARSRRRKRPPPLPRELASQVQRVNPNEYRIGREVVDTLVTQGAELMRGTRTIPVKEDGRIVGVRIANVGKGSLLSKLGIRDGDQIKSINGFSVTTPEQALKAYAGLRTASDLTVTVKRKGKPVTLDYHIR